MALLRMGVTAELAGRPIFRAVPGLGLPRNPIPQETGDKQSFYLTIFHGCSKSIYAHKLIYSEHHTRDLTLRITT
jgi:hypothetical protein